MRRWRPALVAVALGAAFAAGWSLGRREQPVASRSYEIREGRQDYLNPLLECEISGREAAAELRHFGAELDEFVAGVESRPHISRVAVYFRDLNNGLWLGHNEQEGFIPASLAKVPIVIAALRQAQESPSFLARSVRYEGPPEGGFMRPEESLVPGQVYTVDELIHRVARYSDNAAAALLASTLRPSSLALINADLGLPGEDAPGVAKRISPKEYGAVFRILYNASYVGRSLSRLALDALAQSEFVLGLVAGVPPGTVVAHKFGVWRESDSGDLLQLHDCGIVYHAVSPYLICVMTEGTNFVGMATAIADVSRFAHGQIERGRTAGGLQTR